MEAEAASWDDRGRRVDRKAERPEYSKQREEPGQKQRGVEQSSRLWMLQANKGKAERREGRWGRG